MAVLDDVLATVSGARAPSPPNRAARTGLCLVTCDDPRLADVEARLGLKPGDACVVRLPGAGTSAGPELFRAVGGAVALYGCVEVLVLGHSGCALTATADSVAATLEVRGVARGALPSDLRGFLGLLSSPAQSVQQTAAALRALPFLPADVLVHAAMLDDATGEVRVTERGEDFANAPRGVGAPAAGSFSGLPAGLGVGIGAATALASGPMSLDVPRIEAPSLNLTPFTLSLTALQQSNIDLTPTVTFAPPTSFAPSPDLQPTVTFAPPTSLPEPMALASPDFGAMPIAPPPNVPLATEVVGPPPMPKAAPRKPNRKPREAPIPPQLAAKVDKVRAFYLAEIDPGVRSRVRNELSKSYEREDAGSELVKLVIKPLLDAGQKRYRIIDEMIAIKDAAPELPRDACYSLLRSLLG